MSSSPTTTEPIARSVSFADEQLVVDLADGRRICVPLGFYPSLLTASEQQRRQWELIGPGTGIDWPAIDLQLSVRGILDGRPERNRR